MNTTHELNKAADNIRILSAAMVEKANSGHPGGAMGGADFINVLYSEFWNMTLLIHIGMPATVSFWIRDTCRPCYIRYLHSPENTRWKI